MKTLETLLRQAESERDQTRAVLRHAEDHLNRLVAQAEALVAHRGEYEKRWSTQFRSGGTMDIVQHYSNFMARLNEALAQQSALSESARANCARLRADLVAAETRAASVRKLIERRLAEQRRVAARRDQKQ
ncbi:MAG: flagellar export protein FliJ, partial [Burkholderiales bacterium]|nr:flagellar export protein FliJ [Burkholderiales bacterium]